MNYKQALEYMDIVKTYGIVPGLDSIKELCRRLGNPQEELKFVHIAGTNGKGSTLAYISSILQAAKYRVGRYISPVIFDYCEKIQVNSKNISQKKVADYLSLIKEACEKMVEDGLPHPTPFEIETVMSFLYFKEKKCDIVVLETGMGGREDATNLINNTEVAVLVSVGMDHMQFLGDTLQKIAYQKAGIIKSGCKVVCMHQSECVQEVIQREAKEKNCHVTFTGMSGHEKYGIENQFFTYCTEAGKCYEKLKITLAGRFQIENAKVAIEVIEKLNEKGYKISEDALKKGLSDTIWPVRFQIISKKPCVILDGAHNEDAAKKLADSIQFYFTNKRIIYIMGVLRDKEYEKVIRETYQFADHIITVTPPENSRALQALELAECASKYHKKVTAASSLEEAAEMAYVLAGKDDVIICFGSLSYLGKMTKIISNRVKK